MLHSPSIITISLDQQKWEALNVRRQCVVSYSCGTLKFNSRAPWLYIWGNEVQTVGDQLTKCQPASKSEGKELAAGYTRRWLVEPVSHAPWAQASTDLQTCTQSSCHGRLTLVLTRYSAADEEFQRQKVKGRRHWKVKEVYTLSESLYTGMGIPGFLKENLNIMHNC